MPPRPDYNDPALLQSGIPATVQLAVHQERLNGHDKAIDGLTTSVSRATWLIVTSSTTTAAAAAAAVIFGA